MLEATEIRVGNVLSIDGKSYKVLHQEIRGTGKFGKTVHLKLKNVEDAGTIEKSYRAEEKVEDVEIHHVKMQYLYREGEQFVFMNMESYEQFSVSAKAIGRHEAFLKENMELGAEFALGRICTLNFPRVVELRVTSTAPAIKGQGDSTFKEAELENGLTMLVPQFVKEGETIRVNSEDLSYLDRVPTKSLKNQ